MQELRILPLLKKDDGCSYHRLLRPLESMGFDFEDFSKKTLEQHFKEANLILFNRLPGLNLDHFFAEQDKGKGQFKVIMDIDDYWYLPFTHLIYNWWKSNNIPALMERLLIRMDAITVTTERLAERVYKFNKEVHILPNALEIYDFKKVYNKNIRFGYVGGSTHFNDLKSIRGVFISNPNLDFTLCGYNNPKESEGMRNTWDSMERIVSNNYHNKNYKRSGTLDLFNYMQHYQKIDVCLAPLEDNVFNAHKSSLKIYESGAMKCPIICSAVPPFTDDVPDNVVTFCKTSSDWKAAIKKHKDVGYVEDMGEKLFQWVKENRNLKNWSEKRMSIYQNIISK